MDRERLFSYRWHPYAVSADVDYSAEPTTLVEFRLEEATGGTLLTVVESGFDRLPSGRQAEARSLAERAVELYRRKGNVAGMRAAQAMDGLRAPA